MLKISTHGMQKVNWSTLKNTYDVTFPRHCFPETTAISCIGRVLTYFILYFSARTESKIIKCNYLPIHVVP